MVSLMSVLSTCHPCSPAAPGLMCSSPRVLSYFIFSICEWPLMNSCGGEAYILLLMLGSYRPGYPPMCFIRTSTLSHLNLRISGNIRLRSPPSQLPHTARSGRNAANFSASSLEQMSPACHISSHDSKYSRYLSSQYEWVSLIIPILFIAIGLFGKQS